MLGADLVAQVGRQLLAAPAIAQRDGDRALRRGLADDMRVERGDDRLRGQVFVHMSERSSREKFMRSEEHTSELQSLMRSSYAVFCLKKKKKKQKPKSK